MIHVQSSQPHLTRPFWQHADLFAPGSSCFLLDSALFDEKLGRKSFLGGRPSALLTGKRISDQSHWPANWNNDYAGDGHPFRLVLTVWKGPQGQLFPEPEISRWTGDPFEALRQLQNDFGYQGSISAGQEGFQGGLVGYFGYETGYSIEDLPDQGQDDPHLPDLAFMVADAVVQYDHQRDAATLTVTGRGTNEDAAMADAQELESTWLSMLSRVPAEPDPATGPKTQGLLPITGHFDRQSYIQAVQTCKDHILAGDVFEVCLTQRLEMVFHEKAWPLYCRLRHLNPAPFAAYLQFPHFEVVSASPERFLKLDDQRRAESRPIKGTRPRGASPAEDESLRQDLATSEKDRAENLMIVDLVRNDLGRVGKIGSVEVPQMLAVEKYATVFQLVSTVQAQLRDECDAFDLVRSCYPGGSMTGAPKIEAMKIIDSLEPVKRGVYSGALGYLDRDGTLDLAMVIRTIVCAQGMAHFGVGGAITADSDPDAEYQETMDKARALVRALGGQLPDDSGGVLP